MTGQGVIGVDFADPELRAAVGAGLDEVEELLRRSLSSNDPFVREASRHLFLAGGKRFRPLLVLLAASLGDRSRPGVVPAAVVVELTHLATLYHDDVMDEAVVRRGAPSANTRWDNTVAILTGDFLFARASDILADLGTEAVRLQARTFERLVTGQIRETVGPGAGDEPIEHYLQVVAEKTGSLIATSARFGAMFGGVAAGLVEALTRYGEQIGIAFQLSDDIIDIASEETQLGKTPGTDLREGIRTLPMLHALAGDDPAEARLRELLSADLSTDGPHAEALALLRSSPGMDRARETLGSYAASARETLAEVPVGPAHDALLLLCDFVVARTG
ncbi:MAG: polyprenyl synthetase family protein [Actinomycetota bacterium]|nr:polyprenyl synthetase family protein [Actinomycetota bacterium]